MVASSSVQQLKSAFRGDLIVPGDEQYDTARAVYNAAIDRRPALIARCAGADDVIEAVNFAREENLLVAVRGTGHKVAGFAVCDDGLVIDLSRMKSITVDTPARTVIVLEHNGDSAWDRVADSATAFGHRAWPYNFLVTSAWSDPKDAERNIAWTRELFDAMRSFAAPGAYVNYLGGDEGVDGLRAAYGDKLARLAALKAKFDPANLFRVNQNIAPAPASAYDGDSRAT